MSILPAWRLCFPENKCIQSVDVLRDNTCSNNFTLITLSYQCCLIVITTIRHHRKQIVNKVYYHKNLYSVTCTHACEYFSFYKSMKQFKKSRYKNFLSVVR